MVLDTNVVSELMRPRPDLAVVDWVDRQIVEGVFITAVTAAELLYGVARMPRGRRRAALEIAIGELLDLDFGGRILPFDSGAAVEYARVVVDCEVSGRPIGQADAMIAAIALADGAETIVTRNVADFRDTGVPLIDPWTSTDGPGSSIR